MNIPAPFYLALFHMSEAVFCVVRFQTKEDAYVARELIGTAILFGEIREDGSFDKVPRNASWSPYSMMPEVLSREEREVHEDYRDAPILDWHRALLGLPPLEVTATTQ